MTCSHECDHCTDQCSRSPKHPGHHICEYHATGYQTVAK